MTCPSLAWALPTFDEVRRGFQSSETVLLSREGEVLQRVRTDAQTGQVLYRVPHSMALGKASICTIRVAIDEDAILEDIIIDKDTRLKEKIEVSERMSAWPRPVPRADARCFLPVVRSVRRADASATMARKPSSRE